MNIVMKLIKFYFLITMIIVEIYCTHTTCFMYVFILAFYEESDLDHFNYDPYFVVYHYISN